MRLAQLFVPLLLVAGCAAVTPDVPVASRPEAVVTQASAPQPAASQPVAPARAPAAAVTEKGAAARGTEIPAAATRSPAAPASSATAAKPLSQPQAAMPPALDLNALKEQLKETKAIGVFTKLTLKNQVDDLLQQFRDFYQGKAKVTMAQLRRSYDLLLMKVLSLVQDADRQLASSIVASREAIWGLLSDPKKFSTLQG